MMLTLTLILLCVISEMVVDKSVLRTRPVLGTSSTQGSVNMDEGTSAPLIRAQLQRCRINSKLLQAFCLTTNVDTLFGQQDQTRIPLSTDFVR